MDKIIVLDFGGQYCHLLARRIRDLGVFSEIQPFDIKIELLQEISPNAIIFSGGPSSVYENNTPDLPKPFFDLVISKKIPILGICYGFHLIIKYFGGKIETRDKKEYGKTNLEIVDRNLLFDSLKKEQVVWMSHGDQVIELPEGFKTFAKTDTCSVAAFGNPKKLIYGVQFHPEVKHTLEGNKILANFVFKIAQCKKQWKMALKK